MGQISYGLCALTSVICFALLMRGFARSSSTLLLWSSFCFFFLITQNVLLFLDFVIMPQINLSLWRTLAGFVGPTVLLCGLIWERR